MLKIKWSAATNKLSHRSIKDYSLDEYFAGYCTILSKWEMANFPRKKHFNPQAYEPLAKDKAESSINVRSHHIFPSFLLSHPTSRCHHHQFFCHSSPCWQKEEMWVCDVDLRVIETSLLMGNKRAGARKLFHLTHKTLFVWLFALTPLANSGTWLSKLSQAGKKAKVCF